MMEDPNWKTLLGKPMATPQLGARELGAYRGKPMAPRSVTSSKGTMEATITWNAPEDMRGIDGFRLYQGKESNLIFETRDRSCRQHTVKLPANANDICFVSSFTTLRRESPKIPVHVQSNSDQYVTQGTTGATSGTTASPPPEWHNEPSGGNRTPYRYYEF